VLIHVGCEFTQHAENPTHAVAQVEPRPDGNFLVVDARWDTHTAENSWYYLDGLGNLCRRLTLPAGRSVIRYDANVEVSRDIDDGTPDAMEMPAVALPNDVLQYTLPSRFCPSDELGPFAWEHFGALPQGWTRVKAISDWVHEEIEFGYLRTDPTATATDVLTTRSGVCRDFAHLAIALCRALSIPARYAFGYLPDLDVEPNHEVMDFAAWMEVFLADRWWTFDPRNGRALAGRVLIGRGRDALDVAMVSTFGTVVLESMVVWADEIT
jgi:transglutaminase-like putative cysteine protease